MRQNIYLLLLLFLLGGTLSAQIQIANPNMSSITTDPAVVPAVTPSNGTPVDYSIGKNSDFTVQVKTGNAASTSPYQNLFVYNTFVNSSAQGWDSSSNSSFVSFSFTGTITIRVVSNYLTPSGQQSVVIRPLSQNISKTVSGDTIVFTIANPKKLSLEINGNRHRNLHIFANSPVNTSQSPYNITEVSTDKVYRANEGINGVHTYDTNLNGVPKRIWIKAGATLIVPYSGLTYSQSNANIVAADGDEYYIEEGGVLKGGIMIDGKSGIKIYGRGMIDLTNYPKNANGLTVPLTDTNYAFIQGIVMRKASNILIDGVVINDSQQLTVEITDSDHININNTKLFSRVIWGDGFHMKGSSNVSVQDSFIRTADDGISVYASRHTPASWLVPYLNRPALNITVENTSFYSDAAHPITIGWHGNSNTMDRDDPLSPYIPGLDIYNVFVNNIDILEHDQLWQDPPPGNYIHTDYDGAISINCGESNNVNNVLFRDVRVEDFTNGRLFSVNVEPGGFGAAATDGGTVRDIRFENLSYNGYGERHSTIKGLWCETFVDGVHFHNFRVNGVLINSLDGANGQTSYKINGVNAIDTNPYAYNITFEEANRYNTSLTDGDYFIQNIQSGKYLEKNPASDYVTTAANTTTTFQAYQTWRLELIPGTGHYRFINNCDGTVLHNTGTQFIGEDLSPYQWPYYCEGRYLKTMPIAVTGMQEWKIEKSTTTPTYYKVHNAYTRAFLTQDIVQSFGIARPEILASANVPELQQWAIRKIKPNVFTIVFEDCLLERSAKGPEGRSSGNIRFYPNPAKDYLTIQIGEAGENTNLRIIDIQGRVVYSQKITGSETLHNISRLDDGIYMLLIESNGSLLQSEKLVKSR